MHELRIPLDPCNPGQFYACCGLIELFELMGATTQSKFELELRRPRSADFVIESSSQIDMSRLFDGLRAAQYRLICRPGIEQPGNDAISAIEATVFGQTFQLDWWLTPCHDAAAQWKCWAGQLTAAKLFSTLPLLLEAAEFNNSKYTSTRFGVDPRSAWVALDLGYSANVQGDEARTFPFVEMLAAFGLQGHRPCGSRSAGFSYSLWREVLPSLVARSVSAQPWDGLRAQTYSYQVEKRGSYKYFSFAQPQLRAQGVSA